MTATLEAAERDLAAARATLDGLTKREADISSRVTKISERRKVLAFDANVGGGKAKTELKELHRETLTLQTDREDLSAAIAEAQRRVADAGASVAHARAVVDALAHIQRAGVIREAAKAFDEAVEQLVSAIGKFNGAAAAYGIDTFSTRLLVRRSLQSRLWLVRLHSEMLPPAERAPMAPRIEAKIAHGEAKARAKIDGAKAPLQRSAA